MSSPPPETETYEVTLSRDERWVVHHVLTTRLDRAIDDDERPPAWALELFETIESGLETASFTGEQARRLRDALTEYVDRDETPDRDVGHGAAVVDRLEDHLESDG